MNLDYQKDQTYPKLKQRMEEEFQEEQEFSDDLDTVCGEILSELEQANQVLRKLSETC